MITKGGVNMRRDKSEQKLDFSFIGIFAILFIIAEDGQEFIRPIGGEFGAGINDAIEEMRDKFPGCKMRILETNYGGGRKYFEPNGVPRERAF